MARIYLFITGIVGLMCMNKASGYAGYHIMKIHPNTTTTGNRSVEIDCWNKSLNRAGRIEITRHDLTSGPIQINFPNCLANAGLFPGISLSQEWMYMNFTVWKLSSASWFKEAVTVDWPKKNSTTTAYTVADVLVKQDSIHFIFDHLAQSAFIQVPLNGQNAIDSGPLIKFSTVINNISSNDPLRSTLLNISHTSASSDVRPSLPVTDIIVTVDFVITTRLPVSINLATAARVLYLTNDTSISYCPTTKTFVPSQLCQVENERTTTLQSDILPCPSKYLPALPASKEILTADIFQPNYPPCLSAAQLLSPNIGRTTRRSTTGFSKPWPTHLPEVRHFSSENYRMELTITFAVVASVTAVYYLLKCLCNKSDRSGEISSNAVSTTALPSRLEDSRRTSDSHLQVYGRRSDQDLPSYEETNKDAYAPPSYDDIFKPFGHHAGSLPTTDMVSLVTDLENNDNQPVAATPSSSVDFFVIPRPSDRTSTLTNGSINYGFTHFDV